MLLGLRPEAEAKPAPSLKEYLDTKANLVAKLRTKKKNAPDKKQRTELARLFKKTLGHVDFTGLKVVREAFQLPELLPSPMPSDQDCIDGFWYDFEGPESAKFRIFVTTLDLLEDTQQLDVTDIAVDLTRRLYCNDLGRFFVVAPLALTQRSQNTYAYLGFFSQSVVPSLPTHSFALKKSPGRLYFVDFERPALDVRTPKMLACNKGWHRMPGEKPCVIVGGMEESEAFEVCGGQTVLERMYNIVTDCYRRNVQHTTAFKQQQALVQRVLHAIP